MLFQTHIIYFFNNNKDFSWDVFCTSSNDHKSIKKQCKCLQVLWSRIIALYEVKDEKSCPSQLSNLISFCIKLVKHNSNFAPIKDTGSVTCISPLCLSKLWANTRCWGWWEMLGYFQAEPSVAIFPFLLAYSVLVRVMHPTRWGSAL